MLLWVANSERLCSKASLLQTVTSLLFACALPSYWPEKIRKVRFITRWLYFNKTSPLTFSWEYSIFFRTSYFTKQLHWFWWIFNLFSKPDNHCFRRPAREQLSQCNWRNIVTVLSTVLRSHEGLKGTEVFAHRCSKSDLKNLSKFTGWICQSSPCCSPFIAKFHPETLLEKGSLEVFSNEVCETFQNSYFEGMYYEIKSQIKIHFYRGTLTQERSCKFWKKNYKRYF